MTSFRLLTEPASLKRTRRDLPLPRRLRFRLLTEPASLKHDAGEPFLNPRRVCFRLLTEPASLKRGTSGSARRHHS